MNNPSKLIGSQPLLWETASIDSPAVLSDEQLKELTNALMEMLLSSLSTSSAKAPTGGTSNGE